MASSLLRNLRTCGVLLPAASSPRLPPVVQADVSFVMDRESLLERYRELQQYVDWTSADAAAVRSVAALLEPAFKAIVDDFYVEVGRHPRASRVLTGGEAQIQRLKTTLFRWIGDLFCGNYDDDYVLRRWQVGLRHAEIGLDQIFCNVALSRIRAHLAAALHETWTRSSAELHTVARALNKLLDLDLAIIEDAYQTERLARQQQIERLATLGQIAGGLAHELRNPLSIVKTSVYYLLHEQGLAPQKTVEHFQRIERQVEKAESVISALANFARMPVPQSRSFSIGTCIREVLDQGGLPESVELKLEGLDRLPPVTADDGQIQIVLNNLLQNAREAMSEKGRITISGRADGSMVEIVVSDTGSGIPAEELTRIMEPFFTTKPRGLGLGLAISRSIVERNQGDLRVTSEPGVGSTFTIRLRITPSGGE
jgi:two-component system NtrC family sensor kinase